MFIFRVDFIISSFLIASRVSFPAKNEFDKSLSL